MIRIIKRYFFHYTISEAIIPLTLFFLIKNYIMIITFSTATFVYHILFKKYRRLTFYFYSVSIILSKYHLFMAISRKRRTLVEFCGKRLEPQLCW